jgi:outer membrane biosynthesis protein TonB
VGQKDWSQEQHIGQVEQRIVPSRRVVDAAADARSHRSIRWLVLAFVGSLLITAGALIVVGREAEAQESADAPAGESAQPAGSTAEPSPTDSESRPAPESDSQPASEPTPESAPEPAPSDTTSEPAPEPTPQPAPEPAPQPVPEPVPEADVEPALVALGSKLSHEPSLGQSSDNSVPASAMATPSRALPMTPQIARQANLRGRWARWWIPCPIGPRRWPHVPSTW